LPTDFNSEASLKLGRKSNFESLRVTSLFLVDKNADHPEIAMATTDMLIGTHTRQFLPSHVHNRAVSLTRLEIGLPCSSNISLVIQRQSMSHVNETFCFFCCESTHPGYTMEHTYASVSMALCLSSIVIGTGLVQRSLDSGLCGNDMRVGGVSGGVREFGGGGGRGGRRLWWRSPARGRIGRVASTFAWRGSGRG